MATASTATFISQYYIIILLVFNLPGFRPGHIKCYSYCRFILLFLLSLPLFVKVSKAEISNLHGNSTPPPVPLKSLLSSFERYLVFWDLVIQTAVLDTPQLLVIVFNQMTEVNRVPVKMKGPINVTFRLLPIMTDV